MSRKLRTKYFAKDKEFNTYQSMKSYVYFHTSKGDAVLALEMSDDLIITEYIMVREERRLISRKTYDIDEVIKEENSKKQLKLW